MYSRDRRTLSRLDINAKCCVYITMINDSGEPVRRAVTAFVRNINLNTLLITDLNLPTCDLLLRPVKFVLIIEEGPLSSIQLACSLKRVGYYGDSSLILNIDHVSEKHRPVLEKFLF